MPEVTINGAKAYYKESGNGEPICLLHGFSASSYTWRKITPVLSKNFHVFALDLKGFGKSDKPENDDYSTLAFVGWLNEFFEKIGVSQINLAGHSLGGRVGLLMAAYYPEKINKLILINPAAYKPQKQAFFITYARNKFISKFLMGGFLASFCVRKALKKTYYDTSQITKEEVDNYIKQLRSSSGRRGMTSVARAMCNEDMEKIIQNYRKINHPVLLIWGENDEIFSIEMLNRLKNDVKNIEIDLISECGHAPHEEKPDAVCEAITKFIWRKSHV